MPKANSPAIQTDYFALQGGLNLVSPALEIPPGMAIDCENYEPSIYGGYSRMAGIERFDGRTSPSASVYYLMQVAITVAGSIVAGDTVTGAASGATAVVLQVNGQIELVVTRVTGTFVAEAITVAAVPKGTVSTVAQDSATTPLLHAQYLALAANSYRSLISAVPGSGPVRGVKYYNGSVYAFRDNVGATACVMYKATAAGWVAQTFGKELQFVARSGVFTVTIAAPGVITFNNHGAAAGQAFVASTTGALPTGMTAGTTYYVLAPTANNFTFAATPGGAAITTTGTQSGVHTLTITSAQVSEGDAVVGAVSGAVGVVRRALLRTGTWTVAPVGTLVFDTITGTFANGEALLVGGIAKLQANGASTQIALLPGGRFQFDNNNFSGTLATYRMYGCDGVNFAFEFDGTRLVPIRTGITPDAPKYLAVWKNMLVVAVASSVQVSSIGNPYAWTAITGAAELALGDICTGLLPQLGNADTGAIAIFTDRKTYVLYGNSSIDFKLVLQSPDAGAQPYTAQNIGFAYYLDTKGVVQINSTQAYGNFESSTLTRIIQPFIDAKRGLAKASCIVRGKNQYRLFFSDGTGLIMYVVQQATGAGTETGAAAAIMPFNYGSGMYINGMDSTVDASGVERLFAAGSDGFVYELDRGTSIDGANITARLLMSFNNAKSPRTRKHYKRVILQVDCDGVAQVSVGYDLSYAGIESDSGARTSTLLTGAGGYFDIANWDTFNWDSPVVTDYKVDTPGNGRNIGLIFYSDSAIDSVYTISSVIVNYILNRMER